MIKQFIFLYLGFLLAHANENIINDSLFTIVHDSIVYKEWWQLKEKQIVVYNNTVQTITIDSTRIRRSSGVHAVWQLKPYNMLTSPVDISGEDSLSITINLLIPTYYRSYFVDTLIFYIQERPTSLLMTYNPMLSQISRHVGSDVSPTDIFLTGRGSHAEINILLEKECGVMFQLFNCTGKKIHSTSYGKLSRGFHQVPLFSNNTNRSSFTPGTYLLHFTLDSNNEKKTINHKFFLD